MHSKTQFIDIVRLDLITMHPKGANIECGLAERLELELNFSLKMPLLCLPPSFAHRNSIHLSCFIAS